MSLGSINSENNSKNLLCTWKNCIEEGRNSLKDKYGIEWAFLCDKHDKELNDSIDSKDPKKILRSWVLASGGADKLSKRI
jgi:hypothetical protein